MFLNQIIKIFHPTVKPSTTQCKRFFFHAILVIKWDKLLNKLIKGFDMPTEQPILRQLICFCLNCSKKEAAVQPPAPVQPLVRLPYIVFEEIIFFFLHDTWMNINYGICRVKWRMNLNWGERYRDLRTVDADQLSQTTTFYVAFYLFIVAARLDPYEIPPAIRPNQATRTRARYHLIVFQRKIKSTTRLT